MLHHVTPSQFNVLPDTSAMVAIDTLDCGVFAGVNGKTNNISFKTVFFIESKAKTRPIKAKQNNNKHNKTLCNVKEDGPAVYY